MNGSATQVKRTGGNCYLQLTESPWQAGSGFNSKPVALESEGSFSTLFELQITAPTGENVVGDADGPGGDGMAFVLHADPTGSRALGDKGRAIGYAEDPELPATDGIAPSLAVEFDTYQNGSLKEGSGNHIGVNIDGAMVSEVTRELSTRLNDGTKRWAWISYDGTSSTLKIELYEELDAAPLTTLTHSVDLSSIIDPAEVYVGFASATGDAYGCHRVHRWVLDSGQLSADRLSALVGPK